MPGPASKLYAQNVLNLITLMTSKDSDGNAAFAPDYADEILSGSCVTRDGRITHEPTREAIEGRTPRPADRRDLPYDQEADQ
jgi:NAD(P) transhydrogenase subunit alpha